MLEKKNIWLGLALVFVAGLLIGYFVHSKRVLTIIPTEHIEAIKASGIEAQRVAWINISDNIRGKLAAEGKYNCCLKRPCFYCIWKSPGHGEGATCECVKDILRGEHPCGECIGEILEGHGVPELAPYFAKAIANKVGKQHLDHLKSIIATMYNISVEEQV